MPFPTFAKKEEIPKGFESEYHEVEGQWVAKLPDTGKLEETLAKVRQEKKDAEKALRVAEDARADVQRKLEAKEATGQEADKKVAELLAKWEKDKEAAVKAVQDQLDATTGELRQIKLYDRAKTEFIDAGGRPERAAAALKQKKELLDLADDRIVVKNEKGEVTTESVKDFWGKTVKKEFPEWFTGTKASGGGAGGGAGHDPVKGDPSAADELIKNPLKALQTANEAAAA